MKRNNIIILVLAALVMLCITGCLPKKNNHEEANVEDVHVEQVATAPRNGIVLEDETDMNDGESHEMQTENKLKDITASDETFVTEEPDSERKGGISPKVENGDLIQPAGVDSAIEIP